MSKLQKSRILKNCRDSFEEIYSTGKFKNIQPAGIYEAISLFNAFVTTEEKQRTISKEVMEYFKKFGFVIENWQGIGWEISL